MFPTTAVEGGPFTAGGHARREARVREECAHRYPDVRAEHWEAAATVADRVLAGRLLRGSLTPLAGRVLPDAHFEFRGGAEPVGAREATRPRREDRAP